MFDKIDTAHNNKIQKKKNKEIDNNLVPKSFTYNDNIDKTPEGLWPVFMVVINRAKISKSAGRPSPRSTDELVNHGRVSGTKCIRRFVFLRITGAYENFVSFVHTRG